MVVVNSNASTSARVTLGRTYLTMGGKPVTSLRIRPTHAQILRTASASVPTPVVPDRLTVSGLERVHKLAPLRTRLSHRPSQQLMTRRIRTRQPLLLHHNHRLVPMRFALGSYAGSQARVQTVNVAPRMHVAPRAHVERSHHRVARTFIFYWGTWRRLLI